MERIPYKKNNNAKTKTRDKDRERYLKKNPNLSRFKLTDEEKKYNLKRTQIRADWKRRGVLDNDNDKYFKLYEFYFNTKFCESCNVELNTNNKTRKCLDHDHKTGLFRNVICLSCNIKRR